MKTSLFSLRSIPRFAWVVGAVFLLLLVALRNAGPKPTDTARADFLALDALIPPAVPDDQNFAAIPILRGLWDVIAAGEVADPESFRKHFNPIPALDLALPGEEARYGVNVRDNLDVDGVLQGALQGFRHPTPEPGEKPAQTVLRAIEPLHEILAEISAGVRRPYCRFPIRYERGFESLRPPSKFFFRLTFLYGLRATAYLQVGNAQAAAQDVVSMLRLGRHWRMDPGLLGMTGGGNCQFYATQFIGLGIRLDRWTLDQLDDFRRELADVDMLADYKRSARLDLRDFLGAACSVEDRWKAHPADGFFTAMNKTFCRGFLGPIFSSSMTAVARNFALLHASLPGQRPAIFDPSTIINAAAKYDAARWNWNGYALHFFGSEGMQIPMAYMAQVIAIQSGLEHALSAIEIEKHRRVTGRYPASLAGLALPGDLLTGQPRKYEVTADGSRFRLESVFPPWDNGVFSRDHMVRLTQWSSSASSDWPK